MATVNLIPDANGSVIGWLAQGDIFHWKCVDDPVGTPDEDATYVYTNLAAREVSINHVTSSVLVGATISNVRVRARMKYSILGMPPTGVINIGIRFGAARYGLPISLILSDTYRDYDADWLVHPLTGLPWTKADIDHMESSLLSVSVINVHIRCTQIYLIVTYAPSQPVAGKGLVSWTP